VPTFSIIIVHYHTPEALRECLESVFEAGEVIVVDNSFAKLDITTLKNEFPSVNWINPLKNLGFGRACNLGLDAAKNDLVLFLNPDAVALPGALAELGRVFDDDLVAAAGGMLRFQDGRLQESACGELNLWAVIGEQIFLEKSLGKINLWPKYWRSKELVNKGSGPFEVAQVMGACLAVRRETALKVRFDEDFFLYCEDTEFCKRLAQFGKILYVPKAEFTHQLGLSSTGNRWWSIAMYNRGKEMYFAKHHGKFAELLCLKKNREGALLRVILGFFTLRFEYSKTFWKVFTAPKLGPELPDDAK